MRKFEGNIGKLVRLKESESNSPNLEMRRGETLPPAGRYPYEEGFAPIGPARLILNLLARLFADVDRPYDWRHRVFDHKLTLDR